MITRLKRVAWVDDCDYNLHLSNSLVPPLILLHLHLMYQSLRTNAGSRCYAKNVDAARMEWCIKVLAPVYTPDCHMALGASHYVFIKEIPISSEYYMESHLGGWGEKW